MLKVKNGKLSGKGTPDQLVEDFMVVCVYFAQHLFLPTFKDRETARYKMIRCLDDALANIKEAD